MQKNILELIDAICSMDKRLEVVIYAYLKGIYNSKKITKKK